MIFSRAIGWGWVAILLCVVATGGCYGVSGSGDGSGDEAGDGAGVLEGLGDGEIPGAAASGEWDAVTGMPTAAGGAGGGASPAPDGEAMDEVSRFLASLEMTHLPEKS